MTDNELNNAKFYVPDDLDTARQMIDSDVATEDEGFAYSLRAIAHVLLWNAEQQRDWQRKQAEAQRAAEQWRLNQPPPVPPFPSYYPGI